MKSVRNAIVIVESLATGGPAGVGELARRTGIAKSTVQRCLETLAEAGWISGRASTSSGGRTAWDLSSRLRQLTTQRGPIELLAAAQSVMLDLRDRTGDAVHLVVLDGLDVVLLDRVTSPGPVQLVIPVGYRVPAYAAATGKAMLTVMDVDERNRHLPERLSPLTEATLADRERLDAQLVEIERRGYAANVGEWDDAVAAVAAAVVVDGQPIAALSVSSTPARLTDRVDAVGEQVVAAAATLSHAVAANAAH
ncbi:MAG: IclR family transcriptional regulator [Actinomycetota bacterium]